MKSLVPIWVALVALCDGQGCAGDAIQQQQQQQQQQECPATGGSQDSGSARSSGGDPAVDVVVGEVPVIDISALMDPGSCSKSDWDEAAEAVSRACEQWGFFQVSRLLVPCTSK